MDTENLNITLTKTVDYNLKPYGKFAIKWTTKQGHKPNIIPFAELKFDNETSMPLNGTEDAIVKFMKKHKTDILSDDTGKIWYTRINEGLVRVYHKKLLQYNMDSEFSTAVDKGKSF